MLIELSLIYSPVLNPHKDYTVVGEISICIYTC